MTFRIFSVLLCLLAGLPAALAASLSAQDEARLIYLEKRLSELEGRDRELRAYADKAAKGEADGVKDIAAAQVLGAKDGLTGQLAGLNSNFNMLLGFGGVVAALLVAIFFGGAWFAKREARSVAEAEMKTMEGELKAKEGELNTMVAALKQSLETKEQEVLDALRKEAGLLIEAIKVGKQESDGYVETLKAAVSTLAEGSSPPVVTPDKRRENERLKEENKSRPPQDLTKNQLLDLTNQALADGQPAEAARYASALAGKAPDDSYALVLLARSRLAQGLVTEAIDAARLAIEVAQARQDQPGEGVARIELGDALRKAERLQDAQAAYDQSRKIFERLAQRAPDVPEWQWNLAAAWSRLGNVLRDLGKRNDAKAVFTEYRDRMVRLVEQDGTQFDWQRGLSSALGWLGQVLHDEGDYGEAKLAFTKDCELLARLVERNPMEVQWARDLAVAWSYLGDLLLDEGDRDGARKGYIEYRDRMARLVQQDASQVDWQREFAVAQGRLSDMLLEEGGAEEARILHQQECEVFRKLAQNASNDSSRQRDLAAVLRRYTKSTLACGDTVEAASLLEEAGKIVASLLADAPEKPIYRRDHAWIQGVRGDYHAALGNDEDARRLWLEAVTELTALEENKTLNFLGQRALKEYRAKLAAA